MHGKWRIGSHVILGDIPTPDDGGACKAKTVPREPEKEVVFYFRNILKGRDEFLKS